MGKTLQKRTSRAKIVLDIEDLRLLGKLEDFEERKKVLTATGLKKELNVSHNSLLVHVTRLSGLGLIYVFQDPNDYKTKIFKITKYGKMIFDTLVDSQTEVWINGNKIKLWENSK